MSDVEDTPRNGEKCAYPSYPQCTLKVEGATECQSVFVVDKKDQKVNCYLVDNDVAKEFSHVRMGEKGALITGTVEEKDGKLWITASKMEQPSKG